MWEGDCGVLPVVDDAVRPVGMITDRDICMAAAIKGRPLSEIRVGEVSTGEAVFCHADDDVSTAMNAMRHAQVRRLPVVDRDGELVGVLSMNDVIRHSDDARHDGAHHIPFWETINVLKKISEHRNPEVAGGELAVAEVEHEKVSDFDFEE
jgi:signal-transduction protein with cAMP-binding, CBS, and nucleotidyltransferase domain